MNDLLNAVKQWVWTVSLVGVSKGASRAEIADELREVADSLEETYDESDTEELRRLERADMMPSQQFVHEQMPDDTEEAD